MIFRRSWRMVMHALRPAFLLAGLVLGISFLFISPANAATELYSTSFYSDSNLQNYYRLEGNANDAKGSQNGSASNVSYNSNYGKFGQGAAFNGSSSNISIGSFGFSGDAVFSVSLWFKASSSIQNEIMAQVNSTSGEGNQAHLLLNSDLGGSHSIGFHWNGNPAVYTSSSVWTDSIWNHVVFVKPSGNISNSKIYLNGSELTTAVRGSATPNMSSSTANIGSYSNSSLFFQGHLDDCAVFNRALSAGEIASIYLAELSATSTGQFMLDGTTPISAGSTTTEDTVIFGATLSSAGTSTIQFQVEVQPTGSSFTGVPNATSTFVSPGSTTTASFTGSNGSYRWQYRAFETGGATSTWKTFGVDATSTIDFSIAFTTSSQEFYSTYLFNDDDLLAYYRFEGNSEDAKGSNDGTDSNVSYSTEHGKFGQGGGFNGSSSNITLGTFGLTGNASFTVSFWFKASSSAQNEIMLQIEKDGGEGDEAHLLLNSDLGGSHSIGFHWNGNPAVYTSSSVWADGVWNHVAFVKPVGNISNSRIYLNGSQLTTAVRGSDVPSMVSSASHVGSFSNSSLFYSGHLDDLALFDRVLSSGEVLDIYRGVTSTILSGTITTSTIWGHTGAPYIVTSTVTINSGVTVTVDPGVVIKFKDDQSLVVNGTLDVQGATTTSSTLVYFTSYHDDSVGGDTNGNGASTTPAAGKWSTIYNNQGASTTLAGTVVRYGGKYDGTNESSTIYSNNGTLNIRYSDISYSNRNGIYIASGTAVVSHSALHNNYVAITADLGSLTMASSSMYHNSFAQTAASSSPTSTMTNNFWGGWQPLEDLSSSTENSGPLHIVSNPGGSGDQVSSYVMYSPYIESYLINPDTSLGGNPGVNSTTLNMRIGSSTQYQSALNSARNLWNNSSSGYVTLVDASSSTSSTWDIYITDSSFPTSSWAGAWIPSTTSTPYIVFNTDEMEPASADERLCIALHELGHALGLSHSPTSTINVMYNDCATSPRTTIGSQDIKDFNFLWGSAYFFDPHRWKKLIQW